MSNGSISTFSKNSAELSLAAKRWSDLFFTHDIHIVGLTLDVCEIDLWWLLTYRAQLFHSNSGIKNEITLYSTKDRSSNEYAMQKVLFERLHVKVVSVPPKKMPQERQTTKRLRISEVLPSF